MYGNRVLLILSTLHNSMHISGMNFRKLNWSSNDVGLTDGSRKRGRPRLSWLDNITYWTGLNRTRLLVAARNRNYWQDIICHCSQPSQSDVGDVTWRHDNSMHLLNTITGGFYQNDVVHNYYCHHALLTFYVCLNIRVLFLLFSTVRSLCSVFLQLYYEVTLVVHMMFFG